jgi:hypothetical protein
MTQGSLNGLLRVEVGLLDNRCPLEIEKDRSLGNLILE